MSSQTTEPQSAMSDLLATRYSLPATRRVATFNALHLGDNLVHLHFMRALARTYPDIQFTHGAPDQHLAQLAPLAWDLGNLELTSIAHTPQGALNAWRGAEGHWYSHPHRHDFAAYHLDWFSVLSGRMGLISPIRQPSDLLFDYPALDAGPIDGGPDHVLIVNSPPLSGQWAGFSHAAFDGLIRQIYDAGHNVVTTQPSLIGHIPCTQDQGMTVTQIGRLSQRCKAIIGCVTGPMWPCLNIWNAETVQLRIHLLDTERVELCDNTVHANALSLVPEILREHGLL